MYFLDQNDFLLHNDKTRNIEYEYLVFHRTLFPYCKFVSQATQLQNVCKYSKDFCSLLFVWVFVCMCVRVCVCIIVRVCVCVVFVWQLHFLKSEVFNSFSPTEHSPHWEKRPSIEFFCSSLHYVWILQQKDKFIQIRKIYYFSDICCNFMSNSLNKLRKQEQTGW